MKKYVLICMITILLFSSSFVLAEEEIRPSVALERALEYDLDLKEAEIERENADIDYKLGKAEEEFSPSRYERLQLELQLEEARENYRNAENELIIDVFSKYMEILEMQEELNIREKTLELQKKMLDVTESRYRLGQAGELDVLEAESDYEEARHYLRRVENDLEQLKSEFADRLGIFEKDKIIIASLQEPEIMEVTEKEAIEAVVENSFALRASDRRVELAEMNLARAEVGTVSELQLDKIRNKLRRSEIAEKRTRREIEAGARNLYFEFTSAVETLNLRSKRLEQAEKNYNITESQYEAGLKTELDLLSSEIDLMEAEREFNRAVTEYFTAELQLKQNMGHDLGREYDAQLK